MKRKELFNHYISLILCGIIILGFVINLVVPDRSVSTSENRSLQTFPVMDMQELKDGSYTQKLDTWYSDQFVGREAFIHLKYFVSKCLGNNKIDDVYLAKKGRLIEQASASNEEQLNRNLNAINTFYNNHADLKHYFLLAPNSVDVQTQYLPAFVEDDQDAQMDSIYGTLQEGVNKIDIRQTLRDHKDEYIYYKSDHHWTSLGAFYAFQSSAPVLGLEEVSAKDYTVYDVCNDFKGTLTNKTGSIRIKDEIDIYVSNKNPDYICTTDEKKSRSIYSYDGLQSDDPYTVFFGGNAKKIKIETDTDSDKHLLIIKDSYANSYVQFLLPYYRTITIIDPRYYTDDINKVVTNDLITDVMYVYNTNTFVQDTSLADVLGG